MYIAYVDIKKYVSRAIDHENSALCPCGLEAQTTAHALQSCPLHKRERESTWPTESSLRNKLHGTATDLRRGGAVHRPDGTTNISLHRTLKKKKKKKVDQ